MTTNAAENHDPTATGDGQFHADQSPELGLPEGWYEVVWIDGNQPPRVSKCEIIYVIRVGPDGIAHFSTRRDGERKGTAPVAVDPGVVRR